MLDHIGLGVSDYAASKTFFLKALQPLGYVAVMEGPFGIGIGPDGHNVVAVCHAPSR